MITQGGPNSILSVSVQCDRVRSRNTVHPVRLPAALPPGTAWSDRLFAELESSAAPALFQQLAGLGELALQALGVDITVQVS